MLEETLEVPIISPEALEVRHFPGEFKHNSIWDIFAGPDGRIYVSVCSEGNVSASAMLYAYDIAQDKMEHLFDVEKVTHAPPRAIPQSKIHTSMTSMEDGRLIMCTHTTAPAPEQPFWAPYQSYEDPWEGYPGSHIIVYDPKTNHAEDWGIPVPRESTYGGGCYVEEAREYYMCGMMKGHLYAFNVDTGQTKDLGRVGTGVRLFHDDEGRVYGLIAGSMFRYDPFRDVLEDLDLPIPQEGASLAHVDRGPDGLYYIVRLYSQRIFAFDPHPGQYGAVREIGKPMPDAERFRGKGKEIRRFPWVCGLHFAADGILYCGMAHGPLDSMEVLLRWDVVGGGKPEFLGMLYGEGRPTFLISEIVAGYDGRLYLADSNYYHENPRLLIFDPRKASVPGPGHPRVTRPPVRPPYLPEEEWELELIQRSGDATIQAAETVTIPFSRKVLPAGQSDVVGLAVDGAGLIHVATTGTKGGLVVWDGREENPPAVVHLREKGFAALATDGSTVRQKTAGSSMFVATGAGRPSLLAYDAEEAAACAKGKRQLQPRVVATLPEEAEVRSLGVDEMGKRGYGLAGPNHEIFTWEMGSEELRMGPPTGNLVKGRRTIIAGKDGCLYGALDEGWIFRWQPESGEPERLEVRLPGLHGREYTARWESAALATDGSIYGGTGDGYLFLFNPQTGTVRNLGKPTLSFGMPALVLGADGALYGLTGTRDDLSHLFRYTEAEGVRDLGRTVPVATCLAALPDGSILVGGADRINDLVLYRFPSSPAL